MYWLNPVTDRTAEDVEYASAKIAEWREIMAQGQVPTVTDLKGCLNANDLNRIEHNIGFLLYILNNVRPDIPLTMTIKTDWDRADFPTASHVSRVLNNLQSLRTHYYDHPMSPATPNSLLTYNQVNAVERALELFKTMAITKWSKLEGSDWGTAENYTWDTIVILGGF